MAYEVKENSGSLFRNDRKETDSHPNAKGSALIGGVEFWVDAWTNTDRNGNKYQALKFKPKDAQGSQGAPTPRQPIVDDLDDSVPFASCEIGWEHRVR